MEFKVDIDSENFDRFFALKASEMLPQQIDRLPNTIYKKLFTQKGAVSKKRLSFWQKVYILVKSLRYDFYLVIRDNENGRGLEDFMKFTKEKKQRIYTEEIAEETILKNHFVLGNNELCDWLGYLNYLCNSNAYTYAVRLKNKRPIQYPKFRKEAQYICDLLANYEKSKPAFMKVQKFSPTDWYTLLYLYDGKEKNGSDPYKSIFKGVPKANMRLFMSSYKRLMNSGYIKRYGAYSSAMYQITPLGTNAVNELFHKYILP